MPSIMTGNRVGKSSSSSWTPQDFNVTLSNPDGTDSQKAVFTWTAKDYEIEIFSSTDGVNYSLIIRTDGNLGACEKEYMDGETQSLYFYARFLKGTRVLSVPLSLAVAAIAGGERITWDDNNVYPDADYIEIYRESVKIATVAIGTETYDYTTNVLGLPYKIRASGGAFPTNDDFSNYTAEVSLTAATAPAVISDGNTVGWYKYHVAADITKDVNDLVSLWKDNLASGNDIANAGATKPKWQSTGVLFVDDTLTKTFTLNQPEFIYFVAKHITWTVNTSPFDGGVQATGMLRDTATTPGLKAYAGSYSNQNDNLPLNQWGIIRVLFNGASSSFQIDATAKVTGNFGAANMGGFTMGSLAGGVVPGNWEVKEAIVRKVADDDTVSDSIYNYLKAKYAL